MTRGEEGGPDGVFVIGAGNVIENVDDKGAALLGYPREALLGVHGSELVPVAARPATAASIDRMRRGELALRVASFMRRDGTVIRIEVRARPLPDGRLALDMRNISPC